MPYGCYASSVESGGDDSIRSAIAHNQATTRREELLTCSGGLCIEGAGIARVLQQRLDTNGGAVSNVPFSCMMRYPRPDIRIPLMPDAYSVTFDAKSENAA